MSLGFIFWLFWLLWLIFGGYWGYTRSADRPGWFGGYGFTLVLVFILGWRVFGFPIQG